MEANDMKKGEKWTPEEKAKRAANRARKKLEELNRQKLSVSWMDDDLQPMAMQLNPLDRHALAEKLEKRAQQLRGFSQPSVPFVKAASIKIRPKMKDAAIAFAEQFGAKYKTEDEKLDCGIRWVLEISLPRIEELANKTNLHVRYRDAEGFEDSFLSEKLIGDALEKWKSKINQSTEDDDD
jgi:hypothetical protein